MKRRTLLTLLVVINVTLPVMLAGAKAQSTEHLYRIGVLVNRNSVSPETETLRAGMAQLGYVEGTNVAYEVRAAEGHPDRLPGFATDLVSRGVGVIVSYGGPPTDAARKATSTIPIVFALVADPVAIGAATTLERPGGNLTGVTNNDPQFPVRQMALLKEMLPTLTKVTIFSDAFIPGADADGLAPIDRANSAAAHAAGLIPQVLKLRGPMPDFDAAFKAVADAGSEAIVGLEVPSIFAIAKTVAEKATARRIPTMVWGGQEDAGALMSYGTSYISTFPRVPLYVDKIIKGARPAEMAVEVFTNHQLVVNLKTAHALGLTVPPELLKRADRVIN